MWLKFWLVLFYHLSSVTATNGTDEFVTEKTEPTGFPTYLQGNTSDYFRLSTLPSLALSTSATNSQRETKASSLSSSNQSVSVNTANNTMPPNSQTVLVNTTDIITPNSETVFVNTSQPATTVLPILLMNATLGNATSNGTGVVTTSAPNVTFNGTYRLTSFAPDMTNRSVNSSHTDVMTVTPTNSSDVTTPSQVSDTHSPSTSLTPTTASSNDSQSNEVTKGQNTSVPLTTTVISILMSAPTRLSTNSTGKDVKTLTETKTGSALIVVLILVCVAVVLLGLVLYWKKRRVMYSRLNDDHLTRSCSSYNNPVFEDS